MAHILLIIIYIAFISLGQQDPNKASGKPKLINAIYIIASNNENIFYPI